MDSFSLPDVVTESARSSFAQLARIISEAHVRANERAKATHERFNVFTTVLKAGDEVRLHTRFIHCLLDPKGLHDCGSRFLELFFETLKDSKGRDHNDREMPFDLSTKEAAWTVYKEASRSGCGQMDILLERAGYGIAIENKIGAREQENQVSCYADYLTTRFDENSLVIYLTLDGKKSDTAGVKKHYLRISYAIHILDWLEKCLRETYQIIPINQVLLQYREVVRELTGRTLNTENMKPIIEYVRQNPDIIRFRSEIATAAEKAVWETWDAIEDGIKKGLPPGWDWEIVGQVRQGDYSIKMTPPEGHVLQDAGFDILAERDAKDFGIGIRTKKTDSQLPASERAIFEKMSKSMPMDDRNEWYHLGWINLILGVADDKFASVVFNPDIDGICRKVRDYLETLEKSYVAATTDISATSLPDSNGTV